MSNCTKVSFSTEAYAKEHIEKLKGKSKRKVVPSRAYKCNKCSAWHLTSQPNWVEHTKNLEGQIDGLKSQVKDLQDLNSNLRGGDIGKFVKLNEQQKVTISTRNKTIKDLQKTNAELMQNLIKANLKLNAK